MCIFQRNRKLFREWEHIEDKENYETWFSPAGLEFLNDLMMKARKVVIISIRRDVKNTANNEY